MSGKRPLIGPLRWPAIAVCACWPDAREVSAPVRSQRRPETCRPTLQHPIQAMARLGYRPYKREILDRAGLDLPSITLFPITAVARDWDDAQEKFFGENGIIDSVLKQKPS